MAGEGRQMSVGSSGVTENSGFPTITEEEVSGLSVEQLGTAAEELQAVCSLMQTELDLFTRYLSSQQMQEDPAATQTHPAATVLSGSGTATPTVSSLDVRGLWQGQVVTRGRRTPAARLAERDKYQLWHRELEIVMTSRRKQEKAWRQQLHKYQVEVVEAEARVKERSEGAKQLEELVTPTRHTTPMPRLTFTHLRSFMERQVNDRLKQVWAVWVQVWALRAELAKLGTGKRQQGEGGLHPQAHPPSQVDFLRQQLDHAEVRARVHHNTTVLSTLLRRLERERRRCHRLREANVADKARMAELRREAAGLEEEVRRLASTSARITARLHQTSTTTNRRITALHTSTTPQEVTVQGYLSLDTDLACLRKEVKVWRRRAEFHC